VSDRIHTIWLSALLLAAPLAAAETSTARAVPMFRQHCFHCHGKSVAMAGVNLELLTAQPNIADHYAQWEKVAAALAERRMPPEKMKQPAEAERGHAVAWIRSEIAKYAEKNAGDPGRITVRRLTSGEYSYAIEDLTGLDLNIERDFVSDEVGGEGFTSYGDVQFMQDASMERYLETAKRIADHAVIGSGPVSFYIDPGKTGFELSAIARIQAIYNKYGFRTVSGEGGRPYGLDRYGAALFAAWQHKHDPKLSLKDLAQREGITARFAEHIWSVLNRNSLSYPSSEVAARWRNLPAAGKADAKAVRAQCAEIQKYLVTWPSWLFARGDVAAGGAGDERPLEFSDNSLKVQDRHRFRFIRGFRGPRAAPPPPGGTARIYLNAAMVNPNPNAKPVILWRNPAIIFRPGGFRRSDPSGAANDQAVSRRREPENLPRVPLHTVVTEESAKKLAFGQSPDGSVMGEGDFASNGSMAFDVKLPDGISIFELHVEGEVGADRDQVFRVTISDREDGGTRGVPVWGLVGDAKSAGYAAWKAGVFEFARILPPNSHGEPTPADKDPIPEPFDNTYNVPEHDEFVVKVKYIRDDRFVVEKLLDPATIAQLNHAWNDLYASFDYHDEYLTLLAKKFKYDLKGKRIADLDDATFNTLSAELRNYAAPLRTEYAAVQQAQAAARPSHLKDCLEIASRAWRRPLTEKEQQSLRAFYDQQMSADPDHRKAVRALLARILVSPSFLYRLEQASQQSGVKPLSEWELASRLSFFLWSSVPDEELRRAAAAGELNQPEGLNRQVKRMLAEEKARRFSTEFFGQWLGFYRFDQYRGVDPTRFPEFTEAVKTAMYDEAVSFFEHVVRKDRPVTEILHADYSFLNQPLAKHYGIKKEVTSKDKVEMVEGANEFQRGGLLRLGAVLTSTSAPLRTSPVKRGDWLLRRILGIAVPPPPADAGSIPADEKMFGGLSLRERLEVHKRNPTCAGCHVRIDPLGFPLEKYDAVGRWRDQYPDGKPVDDYGVLAGDRKIEGVDGLLEYLKTQEQQVLRTVSRKLVGYALGRTILPSDQPLIEEMAGAGGAAGFTALASHIVTSPQFRNRKQEAEPPRQRAAVTERNR